MKKYMVYMDDGRDCFKAAIPANSEKEVRQALRDAKFGPDEIEFITRCLDFNAIAR